MTTQIANVRTYRGSMNVAFYVGRPTIYGNPFRTRGSQAVTREFAVEGFRQYWYADVQAKLRERAWDELNTVEFLLCWCHPLACHAQIIADWLNDERQRRAT